MFTAKNTVGNSTVKRSQITDLSKPAHFKNPWWHVAIGGSHPVQNQSPDQSQGHCVNMLVTWLLSLWDLCQPVAQTQCKQQSTNKCKYPKVSLKLPGLGNAWTGGGCSQDKSGAGSHIPLVFTSFVRLCNWAMLAICYQQVFLELAWGTAH